MILRVPALPRIPPSPISPILIKVLGVYAILQGLFIVIGGPDRWRSPSFVVIRQVPGSTYTWGTVIIILGVLILVATIGTHFHLKAAALAGLSGWCTAFAVGALYAAASDVRASTTGGPTYLLVAVATAMAIMLDEDQPVLPRATG